MKLPDFNLSSMYCQRRFNEALVIISDEINLAKKHVTHLFFLQETATIDVFFTVFITFVNPKKIIISEFFYVLINAEFLKSCVLFFSKLEILSFRVIWSLMICLVELVNRML